MKFKSNIEIQAGVEAGGSTGSSGQVLSSTGTSVAWIDQSAVASASDFVFFNVKNETGSTILKGKGVMAVGTDGNSGHILIDEMVADGTVEAKYFLGVLEENIANGGFARVISFGQLAQFNTNGQNGETWNDGQILWCDPANPGDFTITEPDGPNVKIAAAFILNSSTNGKIQVRVQANEGVHDLHDTKITSQVDGDVLVWDNTTGVWFNDSTLNVDYTNGRVGIGTTTPGHTLSVNGTVSSDFFRGYTYPNNSFLDFEKDGIAAANFTALASIGRIAYLADTNLNEPASNAAHEFFTGATDIDSATSLMIIQTNGNVGIGTTAPGTTLTVSGVITAAGGNSTQWNTAYTDRNRWDGGATGLNASNGRISLGLGTLAILNTVDAATITDNSVGAAELNVSGNGTTAQYLRSDGDGTFTWATPTNTTYGVATDTVLGLVELFSNTDQTVAANAVTTTAGRTYGLQLNSANQGVINVPWTDTNTTYTAGVGLTLAGTEFSHADTSSQASVNNTGRTFIQDITLDDFGHVTGLVSATDADTFTGTVTSVAASAGTGISVSGSPITTSGTITITNTAPDTGVPAILSNGSVPSLNTGITAAEVRSLIGAGTSSTTGTVTSVATGGGLTGGTITTSGTISHADTSSQASVDNSNGIVIQDVTLDTYGHVTGLASINLDGRYYTESEADSRFFNVAGDTVTGDATFNGTTFWRVSAGDAASQRADSRDDATNFSRLHWYGLTDTGGTSNFRHSWYDGTNYITVTANASGRIDFSGSAATMYIGSDRVFDDGYHPNADTWTTARTITIGNTGKSVSGSANVSWTLAEIGAAPATGGAYLPLSGGTMSGTLNMNGQALNMANGNITAINNLTFNDPGPNEGIEWNGGNGWKIYESPDNLTTNSGGNLQFVTGSTRRMTIDTSGNVFALGSSRAPIFYDSNDTGYYLNPASTSRISKTNLYWSASNNTSGPALRVGKGWNLGIPDNAYDTVVIESNDVATIRVGESDGTQGGMCWGDSNATFTSTHPFRFYTQGTANASVHSGMGGSLGLTITSGYAQSNGSMRAPIFYDSNNTGYYTDPGSTSNLWALTVNGGDLNMYENGTYSSELTFQNNTHKFGIDYQNNETIRFITRSGTTTVPITFQMRAGTITASNFILSSDERKKTKIKDLSRDNIDVNWKSFEMKNNEGEYRVGVIAQELEIKHPEFVNTDTEGFKSVKYIDLLIAKIAELEARLEKAGI